MLFPVNLANTQTLRNYFLICVYLAWLIVFNALIYKHAKSATILLINGMHNHSNAKMFVKKASIMIKKHRFVIIVKFNIVVYATEQCN